jgi:hypothetical protein
MIGMGYTLGWDLVQFIATSEDTRSNTIGLEDDVTHQWLNTRSDVLRIGDRIRFHDPPELEGPVSWSYQCDDIVVHRLKTKQLWSSLKQFFFNCCPPVTDVPRGVCRDSPKSSTCCTPGLCDRACAPVTLRPVEVIEPFKYFSDEDMDHLSPARER